MRTAKALLLSGGIFWAALACAQSSGLPKATLGDAGRAAAFAQFLCNMPGSDIDAFRRKVDALSQGGTTSTEYRAAEAGARALIDEVRRADNGDTRELERSSCPEATGLVQKVLAQP